MDKRRRLDALHREKPIAPLPDYPRAKLSKSSLQSCGRRQKEATGFEKIKFSVLHDFFKIFLAILLTIRSEYCNIIIA
jgi:hypothetical protein